MKSENLTVESTTQDQELDVLARIHENTAVKDHDRAQVTGLSLGMTIATLKRIAGKRLEATREANARNIHYFVTSDRSIWLRDVATAFFAARLPHVVRDKERLVQILNVTETMHFSGALLIG